MKPPLNKPSPGLRPLQRLVMSPWTPAVVFGLSWVCVCVSSGPIIATIVCALGFGFGRFLVWFERTLIQARAARFMCELNGTNIDDLMVAAERIRKDEKLKAECIRQNEERKRHNTTKLSCEPSGKESNE